MHPCLQTKNAKTNISHFYSNCYMQNVEIQNALTIQESAHIISLNFIFQTIDTERVYSMSNFLYSLESVGPLFILVLTGYLLRKYKIINESFISAGSKIVFKISLPIQLFRQIKAADLTTIFNPSLILFAMLSTLVVIALLIVIARAFIPSKSSQGAFIQGIYRGNFSILGVPLAISMFGETGAASTSLLLPFTVPLYNISAVIILTMFRDRAENEKAQKISAVKMLKDIVTNPLIIGIVLGLPFSFFHWSLPAVIETSLSQFASLTTPLALICLGGQFTIQAARKYFKLTFWAVLLKMVLIPVAVVGLAVVMGFRNEELGALFIQFMAPSAVSSYIMAKNMHSDDELAGQILIFTTLISSVTLFIGIFLLKSFHLI